MRLWLLSPWFTLALLAQTAPWPIQYREETRTNPSARLHIATVDLTDPRVQLRVVRGPDPDGPGPWQTTLETVRNLATQHGLDLAINGDYFDGKESMMLMGRRIPYIPGNWGKVMGWAVSDGVTWSRLPSEAVLAVDARGQITIAPGQALPDGAVQAIGGAFVALNYGRKRLLAPGGPITARSGVGLTKDGKRLLFVVADGKQEISEGLTMGQFVDELARLGCYHAIGLDGGGSSTLVVRQQRGRKLELVSRPSDLAGNNPGVERVVGNALGVLVKP
jgi:uncharacterized protein YigE (DUF2233 family)